MQQSAAEQLRDMLVKRLTARAQRVETLEAYREGDHPLPQGMTEALGKVKAQEMRNLHRRLLDASRSNWVGLVVDAPLERLQVNGFRVGDSKDADMVVWSTWQANQFDAQSLLVHDTALTTGQAFVMVWPDPSGVAQITAEHPSEVIVAYEAGQRRERRAALKYWADDTGRRMATLYLPEEIWKWQTETTIDDRYQQVRWVPREVPGETWPLINTQGVVPIVEFRANPTLKPAPCGGGRSEFEGVLSIQDRINETVFGRLVSTHFAAFKQKWATGMEVETDQDGRPINPFEANVGRLWIAENELVKFGEFSETPLTGYLAAVEADIQHLAAISKTPPQYLLGHIVNISGDALKAAESGLTSKVRRHMLFFGESWEEVMRLALKAQGDERAEDPRSEVIWADPETTSESARVDALVKMQSLGVPNEVLWERWGATPTEIARWKSMGAADQLLTEVTTGTTVTGGFVPNGVTVAP